MTSHLLGRHFTAAKFPYDISKRLFTAFLLFCRVFFNATINVKLGQNAYQEL